MYICLYAHRCLFYSQPYAFDEQMQKNPAFKDSFQELFGTDSRMERTRQISHMLMANPSKHYRKLAQELKEAIGYDQYDHHVSVQLRMFYDWPRIRERVLGQIDSYWGCVNRVFNGLAHPSEGDGVPKAKRMIFFTTDDNSMRETAIEHLSPYGTVVFNDHAVEHTSKIGQRHTNSALLDWYMVGEVNAVTTIGMCLFGPYACMSSRVRD